MNLLLDTNNPKGVHDNLGVNVELMSRVWHGSSVGEAPAQHTGHCPTASKDAVRVNRNFRIKGFPNVAGIARSLTVRGAKAWTSGEKKDWFRGGPAMRQPH